jgi:hypothetical protein
VELGTQRAVLKLTKSQKARTADCLTDTPPPTLPFPIYIVKEQNETDNRSQTGAKDTRLVTSTKANRTTFEVPLYRRRAEPLSSHLMAV